MNYYPRRIINTWPVRVISVVIAIAFGYGLWFIIVDSAGYCPDELRKTCNEECHPVSIGTQFGGDGVYQPWNVIGHLIPGMLLVWWKPNKFGLFVAGALISSIIMDSPIWGAVRIEGHSLPLWYKDENGVNFVPTCNIIKWIQYYYNPIGLYAVWDNPSEFPTAAILFWSIIIRAAAAVVLIWWQTKQEKENKDYSLVKFIFRGKIHL